MGKIGKCCCLPPTCCCVESITLDIDGYWTATIPLVNVGHSTVVGYNNATTCTYVPDDEAYEVCEFTTGFTYTEKYLHHNVIEEEEFPRDFYAPNVLLSGDRWFRGDQMFKDVLYWRDLKLEITLRSDGAMKAKLTLYAKQFLIEGIKGGFEATIKNPFDSCSIISDETEDVGMEDWLPCDGYVDAFVSSSGPIAPSVPLIPNPSSSKRIETRSYAYNLVFEAEVDYITGDCDDPITELNSDIYIGPYWGDPLLSQTNGYTMPTAITDTNIISSNCFGYKTDPVTITYKTSGQVTPALVTLLATINYC